MAPFLRRLWAGMLTRNEEDSETDSKIALSVREDSTDRLYHLFPDTSQNDQERGQPNLYEVPEDLVLSAKISPERYVEPVVYIRGDDAWQPEVFFVWGERLEDGAIIPLGLSDQGTFTTPEMRPVTLSTDPNEGRAAAGIRICRLGTEQTIIQSLLLLTNTSSAEDSGTNDRLELRVTTAHGLPPSTVPFPDDTPQEDLETRLPNLYQISVAAFTRHQRSPAISLAIEGDDAWLPSSFFLFGVENSSFHVVPLVHLPVWNLGPLSTDPNEGRSEVQLPLVPLSPLQPPVLSQSASQ